MTARQVSVTFTEKEARALRALAAAAARTDEDAETILGDTHSISAGFRAVSKLTRAIMREPDED